MKTDDFFDDETDNDDKLWMPSFLPREPLVLVCLYTLFGVVSGNSLIAVDSMRFLTLQNGFLSWIPVSDAVFSFHIAIALGMAVNCFGFFLSANFIDTTSVNIMACLGFLSHSTAWNLIAFNQSYCSLVLAFSCLGLGNALCNMALQSIGNMFAVERQELLILSFISVADLAGLMIPKVLTAMARLQPGNTSIIIFNWAVVLFCIALLSLYTFPRRFPPPRRRPLLSSKKKRLVETVDRQHTRCSGVLNSPHLAFPDSVRRRRIALQMDEGVEEPQFSLDAFTPQNRVYTTHIKHHTKETGEFTLNSTSRLLSKNNKSLERASSNYDSDHSRWDDITCVTKQKDMSSKASWSHSSVYIPFHIYQRRSLRKNRSCGRSIKHCPRLTPFMCPKTLSDTGSVGITNDTSKEKESIAQQLFSVYRYNIATQHTPDQWSWCGRLLRQLFLYSNERNTIIRGATLAGTSQWEETTPKPRPLSKPHSFTHTPRHRNAFYSSSRDTKHPSSNPSSASAIDAIIPSHDTFSVIAYTQLLHTEEQQILLNKFRLDVNVHDTAMLSVVQNLLIFLLLFWIQFANTECLIMLRPILHAISNNIRVTDFYMHLFELSFASVPQTAFFILFVGFLAHIYIQWRALISFFGIINLFVLFSFGAHSTTIVWVQVIGFGCIHVFHCLLRGFPLLIFLYLYGKSYGKRLTLYAFLCRAMSCLVWIVWHTFCFTPPMYNQLTRIRALQIVAIVMFLPLILLYTMEPPLKKKIPEMTVVTQQDTSFSCHRDVQQSNVFESQTLQTSFKVPKRPSVSILLLLIPFLPSNLRINLCCFRNADCPSYRDCFGRPWVPKTLLETVST